MVLKPIRTAQDLEGVYVALITPLEHGGGDLHLHRKVDYGQLDIVIDDLVNAGIRRFVAVGTTGQSATVTNDEHLRIISHVVKKANKRKENIQVIAGAGSNSTNESMGLVKEIEKISPRVGLLMTVGYYNCPPQEGIYDHFDAIASRTKLPIIVYNVPSRTSNPMAPQTIVELTKLKGIIGLKQATDFGTKHSGEQTQAWKDMKYILDNTDPNRFRVLSGEDTLVADLLGRGGFGVISATANIPEAARIYEAMIKAASECDHKKMDALQEEANKYVGLVFPPGVKSPIGLHAMFNSPLNLPMVDLSRMQKVKNPNAIAAAQAIHVAFASGMLDSLKKHH